MEHVLNYTIKNCIIQGCAANGILSSCNVVGSEFSNIVNNIIYDNTDDGIYINSQTNLGAEYHIYNNTIVDNDYGLYHAPAAVPSSSILAKNNIAYSNTNGDYGVSATHSGSFVLDYCTSGDGTADDFEGANNTVSTTPAFVNYGGKDFNITVLDTAGLDIGTNLSSDADYPFDTDAISTTRPQGTQWDRGALERIKPSSSSSSCSSSSDANFSSSSSSSCSSSYSSSSSSSDPAFSSSSCSSSSSSDEGDANLEAHWTFDESSGSIASDSTANGNDATIVGTPVWGAGQVGNALTFSSSYCTVENHASLNLTGAFTIALWLKTSGDGTFLGFYGGNPYNGYGGEIDNAIGSTADIKFWTGAWQTATSVSNITDNAWHHIAITMDGSGNWIIYKDGSSVNSSSGGTLPTSDSAQKRIAQNGYSPFANPYTGGMDDARIYSRELSGPEISDLASM